MKRALAAIAAVAMVAVSLVVRARIDDDGGDGGSAPVRVVCATELQAVCDALDGGRVRATVTDASATADALVAAAADGAAAGVDAWLVTAPWAQLVVDARVRTRQPAVLAVGGAPLARSPLVLAAWADRTQALASTCSPLTWRCLGDATTKGWSAYGHPEWGDVKPSLGRPDVGATALPVLGQAVASYFGRTDVDRLDLDEDPGFGAWLTALARSLAVADAPLERMLAQGPSAADAVGTTEAEAASLVARAARGRDLRLTYPAPVATADVVLATAPGARGRRALDAVDRDAALDALHDAGWRVAGRAAPGGAGRVTLPGTSALPAPGVLDDLRVRWRAASR